MTSSRSSLFWTSKDLRTVVVALLSLSGDGVESCCLVSLAIGDGGEELVACGCLAGVVGHERVESLRGAVVSFEGDGRGEFFCRAEDGDRIEDCRLASIGATEANESTLLCRFSRLSIPLPNVDVLHCSDFLVP